MKGNLFFIVPLLLIYYVCSLPSALTVLKIKGATRDNECIQGNQLVHSVAKWAAKNSSELPFVTLATLI